MGTVLRCRSPAHFQRYEYRLLPRYEYRLQGTSGVTSESQSATTLPDCPANEHTKVDETNDWNIDDESCDDRGRLFQAVDGRPESPASFAADEGAVLRSRGP